METRAMDSTDKRSKDKRVKIVSHCLIDPDEPVRTYIYGPGNAFEIEEDHVSGVIIYAADDALAPDIEKGMRLLVNTAIKSYDGDDFYIEILNEEGVSDMKIHLSRCHLDGIDGLEFGYDKVERQSNTFQVTWVFNNISMDFDSMPPAYPVSTL